MIFKNRLSIVVVFIIKSDFFFFSGDLCFYGIIVWVIKAVKLNLV